MNPNTVVELRDAAIYHANDAFREASFKGHKGVQNLILSDVNLSVYPGEMVYLIGRVGSGKSSLLKTLYAELPLREGYGSVVGFRPGAGSGARTCPICAAAWASCFRTTAC